MHIFYKTSMIESFARNY